MVSSTTTDITTTRVLLSPSSEPIAFSDADKYVAWHDAICDEIKALRSNCTWSLVAFHPLIMLRVTNGYIASNVVLMEALNVIKPV